MAQRYRIIFQAYDDNAPEFVIRQQSLLEDALTLPTNCFDFSMGLDKQIALLQTTQGCIIKEKTDLLYKNKKVCSSCGGKLQKYGKKESAFHDVFTDHKLFMQRLKCNACGAEEPSTVQGLINTVQSGDLKKIQASLGAKFT